MVTPLGGSYLGLGRGIVDDCVFDGRGALFSVIGHARRLPAHARRQKMRSTGLVVE